MSEPYTPLMAELREAYQLSDDGLDFKSAFARRGAEFDRALAAHDESVRAEARAADGSKLAEQYNAELVRRTKAEAERDDLATRVRELESRLRADDELMNIAGIDGLQSVCSRVVWLSKSDSALACEQALGRVWRQGMTRKYGDFQQIEIRSKESIDTKVAVTLTETQRAARASMRAPIAA